MVDSEKGLPETFSDWTGHRALILGAGKSGFAAADTLTELGAKVLVLAEEADPELQQLLTVIGAELELSSSENWAKTITEFAPHSAVVSPGFRPDHRVFVDLESIASPPLKINEIELAWALRSWKSKQNPAKWLVAAGALGHQAFELLEQILIAAGRSYYAVGSTLDPVLDAVRLPEQPEFYLVRLDSRQLGLVDSITPHISLLSDFQEAESWDIEEADRMMLMGKVFQNTTDFALYNSLIPKAAFLLENSEVVEGCRAIGVGLAVPGRSEVGIVENLICDRAFLADRANSALEIATLDELANAGYSEAQQVEVALLAIAVARGIGIDIGQIRVGLKLDF